MLTACRNADNYIVERLIQAGAHVNPWSSLGWSALMEAASGGNAEIVEKLPMNGAESDFVDHKYGRRAAEWAWAKGYPDIAQALA